jgi:hypothetical protein
MLSPTLDIQKRDEHSHCAASPCWASSLIPHHKRYARAWYLYNDQNLSDEAKKMLEREMDAAQNDFAWDEFQAFKATLPGYLAHWKALAARAHSALPNAPVQKHGGNVAHNQSTL